MHVGAFLMMLWCWALCLGLAALGVVARGSEASARPTDASDPPASLMRNAFQLSPEFGFNRPGLSPEGVRHVRLLRGLGGSAGRWTLRR
jgi:hypothetical protein